MLKGELTTGWWAEWVRDPCKWKLCQHTMFASLMKAQAKKLRYVTLTHCPVVVTWSFLWLIGWFWFSIFGFLIKGSGQVSVLSQALSGASQSHRLEFTVKSEEELSTVMEELNACDSRTTLQNSVSRFGFSQTVRQKIQHTVAVRNWWNASALLQIFIFFIWVSNVVVPQHIILY